jgi:hypothetical protein
MKQITAKGKINMTYMKQKQNGRQNSLSKQEKKRKRNDTKKEEDKKERKK